MEGLRLRKAVPGDTTRIAEIIAGEPGQEAIGLTGDAETAREFGMAMVRLPHSPQGWEHAVVGEIREKVVAVLQAGRDRREISLSPALVYLALHTFGPLGALRLIPRLRSRRRVQPEIPDGSYHVAEIDVDPQFRNQGIGGALLDHAEAAARRLDCRRMTLTTTTINPARRLYERHGFRVVKTLTDDAYERYTGIEGRHLMVKDLAEDGAKHAGA